MNYITMTIDGVFGSTFTADTDADAVDQAESVGYRVIDIFDGVGFTDDGSAVLVVRGG